MVGLACARDLVLLFVFFDLTAVASYFLIGFDRDRREARGAALMALLVTGVSAVALLLGAVLLYDAYGTFSLPELFERARGRHDHRGRRRADRRRRAGQERAGAAALLAAARDGGADAGVGLPALGGDGGGRGARARPRAPAARARPGRCSTGCSSSGWRRSSIGGVLALAQDELKQILAHSTISQYGYVVALYGIGGAAGRGRRRVLRDHARDRQERAVHDRRRGHRWRRASRGSRTWAGSRARMPVLAVASGVAAATLAALPLTLGFFKDELFFAAARERGPARGGDGGRRRGADVRLHRALLARAVHRRAAVAAARDPGAAGRAGRACWPRSRSSGGFVVGPFAELAGDAATVTHGAAVDVAPAYHLDARAENVMALAAWALGAALLLVRARPRPAWPARSRAPGDRRRAAPLVRRRRCRALNVLLGPAPRRRGARPAHQHRRGARPHRRARRARASRSRRREGSYTVGPVAAGDLPIIVAARALRRRRRSPSSATAGRLRPVLALSVARLRAGRRLRDHRRAGRRARGGARRDDLHARVRRGVLAPAAGRAGAPPPRAARAGATRWPAIVAGVASFADDLGHALAARARRRGDAAEHIARTPRRARRRRRHRDPRRLPRARHDGRDHRAGGRRSSASRACCARGRSW